MPLDVLATPSHKEDQTILAPYKPRITAPQLDKLIQRCLDRQKAQDIVSIDLAGKSDFADRMVIASGTSARHISSLADYVVDALEEEGFSHILVEGKEQGDWILVDAGNVIVHLFRPEIRTMYNLEKMWAPKLPAPEYVMT